MTVIKLNDDDNYIKCEAIKKLGYEVNKATTGCYLSSKQYKNLDQFIDVYYKSINEVLMAFRKDLSMVGYSVVAA